MTTLEQVFLEIGHNANPKPKVPIMQKEQTEHTELETDADIIHAHRNNRMSILTDKMMDRLDLTEDIDDIDEDPFD